MDFPVFQSLPIFSEIESGNVLLNKVLILPKYGEIPFAMVGGISCSFLTFESLPRHNKGSKREVLLYIKLRSAQVVSEHAYGMLKGRWRITYKKMECRKHNATHRLSWLVLHCTTCALSDPCLPHWQLQVKKL